MKRCNRSTVDVREVFQHSIENTLCRCQFGVKWGKIRDALVGFGPPTKVNFSDIIKLSDLKNSLCLCLVVHRALFSATFVVLAEL